MDFHDAWDLTMTWEGGDRLHEVRGDPGGLTRYGLSQRAYPDINLRLITASAARAIARRDYWDKVRARHLPPQLRWHLFDMAFNAGPSTSIMLLQRSVNMCLQARGGTAPLLEIDGFIGPLTLAGASAEVPERLERVFKAYRSEFYLTLAERRSAKFIHGWLRRVEGESNG